VKHIIEGMSAVVNNFLNTFGMDKTNMEIVYDVFSNRFDPTKKELQLEEKFCLTRDSTIESAAGSTLASTLKRLKFSQEE
jgi:hypothetical protein